MAIRQETYAFARPVPYLLERGVLQTITGPIRHGATGALVTPDAASTVVVEKPDGSDLVSGAVTVASSMMTKDVTPTSTDILGEGWEVRWTPVIGAVTYPTIRQAAYLCEYVPPNLIDATALYVRVPELKHRIPQAQDTAGDNTGWQPQIDAAYYDFLQLLIDDARKPWLIREVTGYYRWLLTRSLQLCVQAISAGPSSDWAQKSKDLHFELRGARGEMRLQYSDQAPAMRKGGAPLTRMAPVGRPSW